ncbi:hypothetical protein PIL02S_01943 [Paenibacillus illinoisensis]|uniref:Uncharacterized protein n=1 Tax=Paenibacillus illinoisensis TaxID=59845 RepID=A0A2W0C9Q5_9BACL|nr:hypothetical protein PIL02S_01943 [Paenibacillus illinoisensis]
MYESYDIEYIERSPIPIYLVLSFSLIIVAQLKFLQKSSV